VNRPVGDLLLEKLNGPNGGFLRAHLRKGERAWSGVLPRCWIPDQRERACKSADCEHRRGCYMEIRRDTGDWRCQAVCGLPKCPKAGVLLLPVR